MQPMILPETTLHKLLQGIVLHLKTEWQQATDKSNTLLYYMFHDSSHYKKDYYQQATDLFTREIDHPRRVGTRLFFDASRAKIPTVHITMPSDEAGDDSIGVSESGLVSNVIDQPTQITPIYQRRFDTVFQIVCTSDNHSEVLIMYHALRAGLISVFDTFSFQGLENPKIGGSELRINSDIVPENIFMRGITLRTSYDVNIPRFFSQQKVEQILSQGNPQNE